jgi:hypothetical protein
MVIGLIAGFVLRNITMNVKNKLSIKQLIKKDVLNVIKKDSPNFSINVSIIKTDAILGV